MSENYPVQVSIIVPVYNSEKHLRTLLDSLMYQTVESYEIICVNNGSTDNSGLILEEYQQKYPEKFFAYTIEHSNFVGTGRNYGISKARGKYIYLCDSDDIVEKNGVFFLYNRMKHFDLDACYGQVNFVNTQSNTNFVLKSDGERKVSTSELIKSGAEFWRRMYKKSLLDKVGPMPEDTNFDDIAYLPVVHSYSKNAMSTTRMVYNYFRRSHSTVGGVAPEIVESTVRSEKYALEHCNPEYYDDVLYFVAKRIVGNLSSRWVFRDMLANEINDLMPEFKKSVSIRADNVLYEKLCSNSVSEYDMIPKRVYLSNFDNKLTEERIETVRNTLFDKSCEVIIMDTSNCDVNSMPELCQAIKDGNYEFVSSYFALKNIYENGGFYIDDNIVISKPFNYLRLDSAFFSFIDKNTFSESIFGGVRGNKVIGNILATYSNKKYKNTFLSLARRIKNILTVLYDVPLNGITYRNEDRLAVYAPEIMVCDLYKDSELASVVHICSHDFSDVDDEIACVKYSTLSLMASGSSAGNSAIVTPNHLSEEISILKDENSELKQRVKEIESSAAYRLALTLSAKGRKIKFIRWIVKKIMK